MEARHLDLIGLAQFLINAKKQTYASGDAKRVSPQAPGFKELEYTEGDWNYRDSYSGFYRAPGREVVRFKGKPVWDIHYVGGMKLGCYDDEQLAKNTFAFLKKALMLVKESKPFRGPERFQEGDYEYLCNVEGDITDFKGRERILFKEKEVFVQDYFGGLIIHKC